MKSPDTILENIQEQRKEVWSSIFRAAFSLLWDTAFVLFTVVLFAIALIADGDPIMVWGFHGGMVVFFGVLAVFANRSRLDDIEDFLGILDDYDNIEARVERTRHAWNLLEEQREFEARIEYYRAVYDIDGNRGIN